MQYEEACKSLLSISEYKRLKSIKLPLKQRQYLLSRWLIRQALSNAYNQSIDFWNIEEIAGNFPIIHNLPDDFFLSLSHSHETIVFAISNAAIGVDIEKIIHRKNINEMAELFMAPHELDLFQQHVNPPLFFYQTWCIKEAYFKSLSPVDQQKISLQQIDSTNICSDRNSGEVNTTTIAEYMLAIYSYTSLKAIYCFEMNNASQHFHKILKPFPDTCRNT